MNNVNPYEILKDINKQISNRRIFSYNREILINALIFASKNANLVASLCPNKYYIDQIISEYKTILKFIFMNDNINGKIPDDVNEVTDEFCKMLIEFQSSYTPIRNYLEQCILGLRQIEYDLNTKSFIEPLYDNSSDYSRTIDKIHDGPSAAVKNKTAITLSKYLGLNRKCNIFNDRGILSIYNDYIEVSWLESEIKFDYDFIDFNYNDIIKFSAALKLIADYFIITDCNLGIGYISQQDMVYAINKLSGLNEEKIKLFLKYQTYDINYQNNKITLIQSLILINDNYYFNPITICVGMLPIKMYRLICDYDGLKYEKIISKIAKKKEEQMTNEIINLLSLKYKLDIKTNYKYSEDGKEKAEYDLLILDNDTNNLYIIELKWFFVGDGESDHERLDKKIRNAIKDRKIKDKYIIENPKLISQELFNGKKINNIKEMMVSENFIGKHYYEIETVDFDTLKACTDRCESFEELEQFISSKKYLNFINVKNYKEEIEIEDYKFQIYLCGIEK